VLFLLLVASRLVVAGVIQSCSFVKYLHVCAAHSLSTSFVLVPSGAHGVNWYRLWADKDLWGFSSLRGLIVELAVPL